MKDEDGNTIMTRTPFEQIAHLEAEIMVQRLQREADAREFKDFKVKMDLLTEKIDSLIVILDALKTMGKFADWTQKAVIWCGKVGIALGFVYSVYRFGLLEIAQRVKDIGK